LNGWLDGLWRALDASPRAVEFFFRDDDAGWDDVRLSALLDLFARHALALDVAAIPCAMTAELAAHLRARIDDAPDRVAIHQHGFAHLNHETAGRKCEFGGERPDALIQQDIVLGRRLLAELHGLPVGDIFTPPWNRCTVATGEALRASGFRVLSRDATAKPLGVAGLYELPVTVDWFARRKGVRLSLDEVGAQLARAASVSSAAPVGVMLHHALMDEGEMRRADELLGLLAGHPNARCSLMSALVPKSFPFAAQLADAGLRPATV
jgi:hypothetical protein